jgi:acetylornithine deacetylase/succinyl-diaminopimelate desuccinylase-like protein
MTTPDPVAFLRQLVRVDTTNPPGNETAAAQLTASYLSEAGVNVELHETVAGRANLVARYGDTDSPPLVLLSHLDTVPANPSEWARPPWAADSVDGYIYGRGTLDTKQLTVMQTVALLRMVADGRTPSRPVYLVASADEEAGSRCGVEALRHILPRLFDTPGTVVFTEGGGFPIIVDDTTLYPITCGQKGRVVVSGRVRGSGGHASGPPTDQTLLRLADAIRRIAHVEPPDSVSAVTQHMVAVAGDLLRRVGRTPDGSADEAGRTLLERLYHYATHTSITVSGLTGGDRINVLPQSAEVELDIRIAPGTAIPGPIAQGPLETGETTETDHRAPHQSGRPRPPSTQPTDTRAVVDEVFGPVFDEVFHEWSLSIEEEGFVSSTSDHTYATIVSGLTRHAPSARPVPVIALGRTDGRFFNHSACSVYGFSPVLPQDPFVDVIQRVHGIDERISEESLRWGTDVYTDLLIESVGERT